MAIVYTYPVTNQPTTEDLLLISKVDMDNKTMNTRISDIAELLPSILDLDDFPLYGKLFGDLGAVPDPGDTITYDGNNWVPGPAGTVQTEVISVTATYNPATNTYSGDGVPPPSAYNEIVIYKVIFDTTNTLAASLLNIQSLGNVPLVAPDQSGVLQPIEVDFIQAGTIYYLSYLANTFQISTTPPTPSTSAVEYSNPLAVSIAEDVGGVKANNNEDWAPIQNGVDDQGNPIYRGWTLTEIMNRIFYPYQNPAFRTFKIDGQSSIVEVGTTISSPKDFIWTYNDYYDNVEPGTLSINDITNPINPGAVNPLISNADTASPANNVPIGNPIMYDVQNSHSWRASAETTPENPAGQQTINSPVFTVNWYYKAYYGFSASTSLTASAIVALQYEIGPAQNGGVVNQWNLFNDYPTANNVYWYVCFPDLWNNINTWKTGGSNGVPVETDPTAAFQDDIFRYDIVSGVPVNGVLGQPIDYRVYRTRFDQNAANNIYINI